jgi:hypothetical protein
MSAYELIGVAGRVGVDEIWMIDQAAADGIIEPVTSLDGVAVPSEYKLAGSPEDLQVYAERLGSRLEYDDGCCVMCGAADPSKEISDVEEVCEDCFDDF